MWSRSRRLGLETVSRRSFQTSRSRLGLVETWEGLGLDLVSDWKSIVSVSSRSRTVGSRLQVNMHRFLLRCKLHVHRFECKASILFTDSQARMFTSLLHTFAIAMQYTLFKKSFSLTLLMQNLFNYVFIINWAKPVCLNAETESPIQSLLTHRCSIRVLDSSDYSVQALMVSVALYCLLCIVLQHGNIIMAALRSRCGYFIFILWFLLLLSFPSSPNLSLRRLDVYHRPTSTHGVALVRI